MNLMFSLFSSYKYICKISHMLISNNVIKFFQISSNCIFAMDILVWSSVRRRGAVSAVFTETVEGRQKKQR